MSDILLICIILLTVSAIISVIYFIIAMNQITHTAKKLEEILDKTNCELDSVHKISGRVLEVVDFFPKTWMKIATTVLPLATSFVLKKRK